jgi:hypothetical protein
MERNKTKNGNIENNVVFGSENNRNGVVIVLLLLFSITSFSTCMSTNSKMPSQQERDNSYNDELESKNILGKLLYI